MIQLTRQLPNEVKAVINPVIMRNSYVAHPENLLLAMVADERPHIRQLGLHRIMKACSQLITGVRQFKVPNINFSATNYIDLINWSDTIIAAPPLLSLIPLDEISSRVFEGNADLLHFLRFVCLILFFKLYSPCGITITRYNNITGIIL